MKKARVLSFGMNQMGDSYGIKPGIHAEQDAINKLQSLNNKKKLEPINLLVIRLSSKNNLQSSKPCANCIESMKILPTKKGYKIQNIYYSDAGGNIIKTNLTCLDNEEKHYSRFYKKKNK
jgi:cytidine deaminase